MFERTDGQTKRERDEVRHDAIHPSLRYGRRRGVILSLYARDRALLPPIAQLLQAGEAAFRLRLLVALGVGRLSIHSGGAVNVSGDRIVLWLLRFFLDLLLVHGTGRTTAPN